MEEAEPRMTQVFWLESLDGMFEPGMEKRNQEFNFGHVLKMSVRYPSHFFSLFCFGSSARPLLLSHLSEWVNEVL